jgi:hypothetical protein
LLPLGLESGPRQRPNEKKGNDLAMISRAVVDTTFDFRSDTPQGRDPDADGPTLRRYHQALWSKPLPCGAVFEL